MNNLYHEIFTHDGTLLRRMNATIMFLRVESNQIRNVLNQI